MMRLLSVPRRQRAVHQRNFRGKLSGVAGSFRQGDEMVRGWRKTRTSRAAASSGYTDIALVLVRAYHGRNTKFVLVDRHPLQEFRTVNPIHAGFIPFSVACMGTLAFCCVVGDLFPFVFLLVLVTKARIIGNRQESNDSSMKRNNGLPSVICHQEAGPATSSVYIRTEAIPPLV